MYLRRQDDHAISLYQQRVKAGETRRLVSWLRNNDDFIYDYGQRLDQIVQALEPTTIVVRRFEHSAFRDGKLEADFLDATGINAAGLAPVGTKNETMDAATVEFLRLYSLHQLDHAGARPGLMDHRALVRRLGAHFIGPALSLPDATLDQFMATWEGPNRAVAERFLGVPELFLTSRRQHVTTDRQVLDPDELEDLMEIAEFPTELRARMRDIAQREAVAT